MINSMCHQENKERCGKEWLGWSWGVESGVRVGGDPLRGSA